MMNKPIHIPKRGTQVGEQIMNIMDDTVNNKTSEIEFRLGDIIQFYTQKNDLNNLVFHGDYKITEAKFYMFDLSSIGYGVTGGSYIIKELKLSDSQKKIIRNEYPLEYQGKTKKCYNKTNWKQPKWGFNYYKFSGIILPGEDISGRFDEPVASFYARSGDGYSCRVKRGEGPQTIFTIKSLLNKKSLKLFDIQLCYYYKCHKHS